MARISGVTLPNEKCVDIALTYIFGIGLTTSRRLLDELKIKPDTRVKQLAETDVNKLRQMIEKTLKVEGDLKREVLTNIKRLKEIKTYRGSRHDRRLPARGQRSKTNSRTIRGNVRRTMGSGKKPTAQKT